MRKFKLALIQMVVGASKPDNVSRATKFIKEAAEAGAKIVSLPECFNSPYGTKYFPEYAEPIPGPSTEALATAARENSVFLVGGSIPEEEGGKFYNTCPVFNPKGELIAKHRKIHLFNIDVPGKIRFQESDTLSPGNQLTVVETPFCKIGVGICYDIRFAEMALLMARQGCDLLVYPGAFNTTTGPAHWEGLQRARALDNQVYVATASPARDTSAEYVAYGYSMLLSPWGDIVSSAVEKETIVYADVDLDRLEEVRTNIPMRHQRRHDIYTVTESAGGDSK